MGTGYAEGTGGTDLTEDRRDYSLQGKIMLFVAVILSVLVVFSMILCIHLRRVKRLRRDREDDCDDAQATAQRSAMGSKGQINFALGGHQ